MSLPPTEIPKAYEVGGENYHRIGRGPSVCSECLHPWEVDYPDIPKNHPDHVLRCVSCGAVVAEPEYYEEK